MRRVSLLILCALLIGGCASRPESSDGGSMEDPRSVLQQRPSMEDVTARYEEMQQKLRDRLSAELGLATPWENDGDIGEAACQGEEFSQIDGAEEHSLARWVYRGSIPDSQWAQAERIADEVSSEYGFVEREVVVNRPADHKVEIRDGFGAALQFGTAVNTILSLRTGCHLLQSAKGGPA
ncbi:LppA family lipoprotein [Saccharopolyspora sp. K220]|uniref:LppA family lipoprotein n=1 Tax=Saccharopolyspora soli TaxID=2926618 RepID=UPI001F5A27C0|nr:LppA family lipoprotein [Saccharopolyspora soli]MCI2417705.1 LppA family lipoprotein [Saccharopolyspora soli]